MNNTDVTVILPIHSVDGKFEEWFSKSIKSFYLGLSGEYVNLNDKSGRQNNLIRDRI